MENDPIKFEDKSTYDGSVSELCQNTVIKKEISDTNLEGVTDPEEMTESDVTKSDAKEVDSSQSKSISKEKKESSRTEIKSHKSGSEKSTQPQLDKHGKHVSGGSQGRRIYEADIFKPVEKTLLRDLKNIKAEEKQLQGSEKQSEEKAFNVLDIMSNMKAQRKESEERKKLLSVI